jgi:hypothetical protein
MTRNLYYNVDDRELNIYSISIHYMQAYPFAKILNFKYTFFKMYDNLIYCRDNTKINIINIVDKTIYTKELNSYIVDFYIYNITCFICRNKIEIIYPDGKLSRYLLEQKYSLNNVKIQPNPETGIYSWINSNTIIKIDVENGIVTGTPLNSDDYYYQYDSSNVISTSESEKIIASSNKIVFQHGIINIEDIGIEKYGSNPELFFTKNVSINSLGTQLICSIHHYDDDNPDEPPDYVYIAVIDIKSRTVLKLINIGQSLCEVGFMNTGDVDIPDECAVLDLKNFKQVNVD